MWSLRPRAAPQRRVLFLMSWQRPRQHQPSRQRHQLRSECLFDAADNRPGRHSGAIGNARAGSDRRDAPGVGTVTVSGMHSFGVMEVGSSTTAELDGLTISDGSATDGGGIDNAGTLTLFDVTLSSNTAAFGGAIYNSNSGTLTIGGTLSGNTASFSGGGIYNDGGDVKISGGCTIASNSAAAPAAASIRWRRGRDHRRPGYIQRGGRRRRRRLRQWRIPDDHRRHSRR